MLQVAYSNFYNEHDRSTRVNQNCRCFMHRALHMYHAFCHHPKISFLPSASNPSQETACTTLEVSFKLTHYIISSTDSKGSISMEASYVPINSLPSGQKSCSNAPPISTEFPFPQRQISSSIKHFTRLSERDMP